MTVIQSVKNPLVKAWLRLHRPAGRRQAGVFLVEGRRAIEGFRQAGWAIQDGLLRADLEQPSDWPPFRLVSAAVVDRLSQSQTPSGYLAMIAVPSATTIAPEQGGLLLWGLRDPGNLGTLVRSAVAFGHRQVILVDCCDPFAAKVVQSSAGCLAAVQLVEWEDQQGLALLQQAPGVALVARDGIAPEDLPQEPVWMLVGSEAHGLPQMVSQACRFRVTLPMHPEAESLNAAMAGTIMAYLRRR